MPPKAKVTKEDIIEAAFIIAKENGFSAITARTLAKHLGCSVAPIYVNFKTIDELMDAVIKRVFALSEELMAEQNGSDVFENMGKASIAFARKYPVLLRELIMKPNPYMENYDTVENYLLETMAKSEEMKDWTLEERRRLLLKVRCFQIGMEVMLANRMIPSWFQEDDAETLLMEVGEDLFLGQNRKYREG
ncbi:TetR/AcrR family transcriptional regulator [Mobilitalea sibirica]|uniref:TetR/AcrR family transcriptional regulator n=1 Tax=Mobilitalea sibirica TaxID=1462919 RepID=A0A8J7HBD3_9FIRM|nr:TetR family transcriptional regulator [Mobilitalea sibirica]MBH1940946.1 TetR/AcrR family transcriptional regulator [Mobilitalea sibirica]